MKSTIADALNSIVSKHSTELKMLLQASKNDIKRIEDLGQQVAGKESMAVQLLKTVEKLTADLAAKQAAAKIAEMTEKGLADANVLVNTKSVELTAVLEAFSGITFSTLYLGYEATVCEVQGDWSKLSGPFTQVRDDLCDRAQNALDNALRVFFELS